MKDVVGIIRELIRWDTTTKALASVVRDIITRMKKDIRKHPQENKYER